jgi:hypothetical protein
MKIDTYFGLFAQSVFAAMAGSLGAQTAKQVRVERVDLSATNTLKLRWSDVSTALIPRLAQAGDVPFVFALTAKDVAALTRLAGARCSLQTLLEQAVGSAVEPFNFMNKTRNKLAGLTFSPNVTGLTAHHLGGEVRYTMATGRFQGDGAPFALRLLVSAPGRDRIEERAGQQTTQRALFTVTSGAYVCRPQWEPPPPPPGAERGPGLNPEALNGWLGSYFGRNDGEVVNRLFSRTAGLQCRVIQSPELRALLGTAPVTVVRMQLNGQPALELFVLLAAATKRALMTLSKSGQERFLGDFFRVLFGESAQVWGRFGDSALQWSVAGVRDIPADALDAVESRLKGGGFLARQTARLDDGRLEWALAVTPHAWRALLLPAGQGVGLAPADAPHRAAIYAACGWGLGRLPWPALIRSAAARDLGELARQIAQASPGAPEALAALTESLPPEARDPWLAPMPANLRERTLAQRLEPGAGERQLARLTDTLLALNRAGKLPEGKFSAWLALYGELLWARRQVLADTLLPLRHLVYGMDRGSLSRLMVDAKDAVLVDLLCWAEFPVLDQMRRAVTPGFALRLLEGVAGKRRRVNAFTAQEAQFALYRRAAQGAQQGRYLLRTTPADRLGQVLRALDGGN